MNVMVVGLGYVGSVVAAGLAGAGHQVIGVDINQTKINEYRNNGAGISEPELTTIITTSLQKKTLRFFHTSEIDVITESIIFVCVGTPTKADNSVDLSQVFSTIEWIKQKASHPTTIVMKSTVPPGTGESIVKNKLSGCSNQLSYVMNPEFLSEGQALKDWLFPDRTVVGSNSKAALEQMHELYRDIPAPFIDTDITTAEMIKYSANAFLATKISFINKIAKLCEGVGANVDTVALGIGLDKRIGVSFLHAGLGYGGSCFPKDVKALENIFDKKEIHYGLLHAVIDINNKQRVQAVNKLRSVLGDLKGQRVAVLGLAFKPGTDDIRDAPSLDIIKMLSSEGAIITAYDPVANHNAASLLSRHVQICHNALEALNSARGVIIATEWSEFLTLDWSHVKTIMQAPYAVIDGRNCLSPSLLIGFGFRYIGFGRSNYSGLTTLAIGLSTLCAGMVNEIIL
jgi:UDPglucose 6-dehydrogenase